MISEIGGMIADLGMVFAPCIGYMIQTQKMVTTQSAEGFSTLVSFILIVSNVIRVFWWLAERFSKVILYASILMIACQFSLLYFWVKINNQKSEKKEAKPEEVAKKQKFWEWNSFGAYLKTVSLICFIFGGLALIFSQYQAYSLVVGTLSSGVEAMLGTPQFWLNYKRKNTQGLSVVLILMWLAGDLYKLSYYGSQNAPIQLLMCAGFQVLTDLAILSQFWLYRNFGKNQPEEEKKFEQAPQSDQKKQNETTIDIELTLETASSNRSTNADNNLV